jgi:hypothetical protein
LPRFKADSIQSESGNAVSRPHTAGLHAGHEAPCFDSEISSTSGSFFDYSVVCRERFPGSESEGLLSELRCHIRYLL